MGQQICIKLAELGCNIVIADIDFKSATQTAENLQKLGISTKAYKVDVSNFAEILKLKSDVLKDVGEVDILVNNAGIVAYKTILEQSFEEIERLTRINLNSVILVSYFEGLKCFQHSNLLKKLF